MKRLHLPRAHEGERSVDGAPFHHLARVLRVKAGDVLEVFDGEGQLFDAKVSRLDADALTLNLSNARAAPALAPLTLIQGLPKGDKLEQVLQKGTELGAFAFIPVVTDRAVSRPKDPLAKAQRWQKIAAEAARQCGRADVPKVAPPCTLAEAVAALAAGTQVLVLDEEEKTVRLTDVASSGPLALVIGPEGGLTRDEVKSLREKGAQTVTLGPRILRTETAALAALSVLLHVHGELG